MTRRSREGDREMVVSIIDLGGTGDTGSASLASSPKVWDSSSHAEVGGWVGKRRSFTPSPGRVGSSALPRHGGRLRLPFRLGWPSDAGRRQFEAMRRDAARCDATRRDAMRRCATRCNSMRRAVSDMNRSDATARDDACACARTRSAVRVMCVRGGAMRHQGLVPSASALTLRLCADSIRRVML